MRKIISVLGRSGAAFRAGISRGVALVGRVCRSVATEGLALAGIILVFGALPLALTGAVVFVVAYAFRLGLGL